MPFTALHVPSSKHVQIVGVTNPRELWLPGDLQCHLPGCGLPVSVIQGVEVSNHFRHHGGKCGCPYLDDEQWSESPQHRLGKRLVARYRVKEIENVGVAATAEFEVAFPELRRIADVLIRWPAGWCEAHEVQVSSISAAEIDERTKAYWAGGVDVWWWFCRDRGVDNAAARDMVARLGAPLGTIEYGASEKAYGTGIANMGGALEVASSRVVHE